MTASPRLPRSPLQAVVLDVDGTLYDAKPVRQGMLLRLLRAHLLRPFAGARTVRALQAYRHALEDVRATTPDGNAAEAQFELAARAANVGVDELRAVVGRWMLDEPLPLLRAARRHGLVDFLTEVRRQGVRVGVFSDYPVEAKLRALEIDGLVDVAVHTGAAGIDRFKPHPDGILATLELLGVEPAHAVYVGDRDDVDAVAADRADVACVLVATRPVPGATWIGAGDFDTVSHLLFSGGFVA